jgi:DNA-binding transcriptional MerR regulator
MNVFSIRDIENLTGIKAHTLRIWEQRYDIICPKRKESKHRFYDNDDLKYLLRIAYLYNLGYKISRIACLCEDEIRKLALETRQDGENYEIFVNQLTEASIDFDTVRFEKILHNLVLHAGFEKSISCVVFPMLKKLGLLWLTGNVIPAQEHFASALVIKKIAVATDGLDRPACTGGRRVLVFAPAGEFHEIPILYMQYLLRKHGIPCLYSGRNISLEMLKEICDHQRVTQLYFHLITKLIRCDINEYLLKLSKTFPDKEIVFSGSSICQVDCSLPNVRILKNTEEMLQFSK